MVFRLLCGMESESQLAPGYKFEWQVLLDHQEDGIVRWGVFEESYQRCFTQTYFRSWPGTKIIFKPDRSSRFEIDLDRMTQNEIHCFSGMGCCRDIRCVIVPCDGHEWVSRQTIPLTPSTVSETQT